MGRPSRSQPTVTTRADGSLYSSHRVSREGLRRWDDPDTVGMPTIDAVRLDGDRVQRETRRQAKIKARGKTRDGRRIIHRRRKGKSS